MTTGQFNLPKLSDALFAGALWFVGIGVVGAVSAVNFPGSLLSDLVVMLFGILGASVLLAGFSALRRADEAQAAQRVNATVNTHRRGASRAA